jgi:Xaa-Pro aminopeptidase
MSHAPTATLERRHQAVRHEAATRGIDALVVTSLPNVLYLTNFTGSSAIAIVTADRLHFLTDFRYVTAVNDARGTAQECPGLELTVVDGSRLDARARLSSLPVTRIGFEATNWSSAAIGCSKRRSRNTALTSWSRPTPRRGPARREGRLRDRDAA